MLKSVSLFQNMRSKPFLLTVIMTFAGAWPMLVEGEIPAPVQRPQMMLPALGEEVALPRIKEICKFYGLHELWRKIERDPPPLPFKSDGCTGWFNEWKGVSL